MELVKNFMRSSKAEKTAVVLILAQLIIKITIEIRKSFEATMAIVPIVAIMLTVAWIAIIIACLYRKKNGYLWGGIVGVLHVVLALPLPFTGTCNHYFMAIFVSVHGLLITVFSFLAYRGLTKHLSTNGGK